MDTTFSLLMGQDFFHPKLFTANANEIQANDFWVMYVVSTPISLWSYQKMGWLQIRLIYVFCQELGIRFITVVKPDGNKTLYEWLDGIVREEHEIYDSHPRKSPLHGRNHLFSVTNAFFLRQPLRGCHRQKSLVAKKIWISLVQSTCSTEKICKVCH